MLQLNQASYCVGKKTILQEQNLTVPTGKLLALVGPNGAGKSTLMGLLSGRITPTAGGVFLDGQLLQDWSPMQLAKRRAVMSQQASLAFGFTAREVVALGRSAFGRQADNEAIVSQALVAACVSHLADRSFPTLSGGEQQRVQFARALAQVWDADPASSWLLLDEPDAGLDVGHQDVMLRVAKQLAQKGFGVAVVLHNLNLAARYADNIALIHNGKIEREGSPWQVLEPDYLSGIYDIELQRIKDKQGACIIAPASVPSTGSGPRLQLVPNT